MDFENMNIWCWLIIGLVGIICAIFGYLIGKSASETNPVDSENVKALTDKNKKLEADLEACKKQAPKTSPSSIAPKATAAAPYDAKFVRSILGKPVSLDDLKVVEGIGPKIEGLFHNFDIKTWKALSECKVAKCQEVLSSAGNRYKIHDPASWPMQAKLCHKGQWEKLHKWQEEHKHGKL
ncbi:MAG: hypothetical protein COA50_09065 [Flavobacteriaceae bacterium]|nr:MAG: hypothetical protein COA50_09065 [Flavobacteriaceae bacterium]